MNLRTVKSASASRLSVLTVFQWILPIKFSQVRKSGITLAPEAGTQRLRDVINKGVTEEDLMEACGNAFKSGWSTVKLYFMMGLPTETDEDLAGIAEWPTGWTGSIMR